MSYITFTHAGLPFRANADASVLEYQVGRHGDWFKLEPGKPNSAAAAAKAFEAAHAAIDAAAQHDELVAFTVPANVVTTPGAVIVNETVTYALPSKSLMLTKEQATCILNAITSLLLIGGTGMFYLDGVTISYGKEGRVSVDASRVGGPAAAFETYKSEVAFAETYKVGL